MVVLDPLLSEGEVPQRKETTIQFKWRCIIYVYKLYKMYV